MGVLLTPIIVKETPALREIYMAPPGTVDYALRAVT